MNHEQTVRLIETLAYNLYRNTLIGNAPPNIQEAHDDLTHPKPGDLVVEISTIYNQGARGRDGMEPRGLCGIGRLVRKCSEPFCSMQEWIDVHGGEEAEPIPEEHVWYILLEFDDGREYRWTNAVFIKVPEGIF